MLREQTKDIEDSKKTHKGHKAIQITHKDIEKTQRW